MDWTAFWIGYWRGVILAHKWAALAALLLLAPGCSRPSTPAEAAPVVKPTADADECPGGVCHVPRPK